MKTKSMKALMFIVLIAGSMFLSGCVESGSEDVVISYWDNLDSGNYENAVDQLVYLDYEPLSSDEELRAISFFEYNYGMKGEYADIQNIEITNKEEISFGQYNGYSIEILITVIYKGETQTKTVNHAVIKIDGEWKIVRQSF